MFKKSPAPSPRKSRAGFGLIWMLGGLAIAGLAAGLMVPVIREMLDRAALSAEEAVMEDLAESIRRSWTNPELTRNLALAGTGVGAVQSGNINATTASATITSGTFTGVWTPNMGVGSTEAPYLMVAPSGSFDQKNVLTVTSMDITDATDSGGPYTSANRLSREAGDPGRVLFNSRGFKRFMVRGPTNELSLQRWLLVSVMTPIGNTAIRTLPDLTFDQLWNLGSGNPTIALPGSGALVNEWNREFLGRTHASRIVVRRITQGKHRLILSNQSSDRYLHVQIADRGTAYWPAGSATVTQANFVLSPGEAGPQGLVLLHGTGIEVWSGTLRPALRSGNNTWTPASAVAGDIEDGPHVLSNFRIQDTTTLVLNPAGLN